MNPFELLWSLGDIQSFVDHAKASDEGDPWGFAGLGADGVGTAQSFLGKAAETPVIEAGLIIITIMNWACGFGESEKGDRFGDGGSKFNEIIEKLESAAPDGSWQGSGSDAYASQNVKQQDRASTMVDADFEMNQIISCEANQLSGTRDILDHAGTVLGYAILPALAAMRIPVWGWEISMGIQLGAVGGTVPVCQAEMTQMAFRAIENAKSVRKAIDKYNSANPNPKTRTQQVGLWGAPRSDSSDQTTDGAPGQASPVSSPGPNSAPTNPPSHAPHAPSGPAPTIPSNPVPSAPSSPTPPSFPSNPAPSVPPRAGESPSLGSPPPSSKPPVAPAPAMPTSPQGHGSFANPGGAPASGPTSTPTSPTNKSVAKTAVPQATSGSTNSERAPVDFEAQSQGEAQSASEASTRTGVHDVR